MHERPLWRSFLYDRLWPGPEILAINLIAEYQPFDSTWHEKFRCNRPGQLMADLCLLRDYDVQPETCNTRVGGVKFKLMKRKKTGHL